MYNTNMIFFFYKANENANKTKQYKIIIKYICDHFCSLIPANNDFWFWEPRKCEKAPYYLLILIMLLNVEIYINYD